jgi:hypothetical protein
MLRVLYWASLLVVEFVLFLYLGLDAALQWVSTRFVLPAYFVLIDIGMIVFIIYNGVMLGKQFSSTGVYLPPRVKQYIRFVNT